MTKNEFFEEFVTTNEIKRLSSGLGSRKMNHAILKNGWSLPISFLAALRRLCPPETEIKIRRPIFHSDVALEFSYARGDITLYYWLLDTLEIGDL